MGVNSDNICKASFTVAETVDIRVSCVTLLQTLNNRSFSYVVTSVASLPSWQVVGEYGLQAQSLSYTPLYYGCSLNTY